MKILLRFTCIVFFVYLFASDSNGQSTLIHYWSFNSLTTAFHLPNIPSLTADFSVIDTNKAKVVYAVIPGTSNTYAGFWDNNSGDTTNARNGFAAGNSLRFRNPSDSAELRVYAPTTSYSNIVIKYALESSSTTSGQKTQLFDYSIDSGLTWKTSGLDITSLDVTQAKFQGALWGLVTLNITGDTTAFNNSKFVFRIRFSGQNTGSSGNNRFENLSIEGTFTPPVSNVPLSLIHYWNFNTLLTAYHNPGIPRLAADFSAIDTNAAKLAYMLVPGTSSSYAGFIDNNPGDLTNARNGAPAGQSLRFRNPSDSAELRLYAPTTNYKNIVIKYALQSSSVGSGQKTQLFDYSTDGGFSWKTTGLSITSLDVTQPQFQGSNWGFVTVSFPNDTTVNDNYAFVFRIRFSGNTTGGSGNNRFDNITVEGTFVPPVAAIYNIISPKAGDILTVGKHAQISFSVSGPVGAKRRVEYSTDRGLTWNFIALTTGTSIDWIVPYASTTNAFLRVVDEKANWGGVAPLTIFYPGHGVITVTKPLGGDTLIFGSKATVTFAVSGVVSETRFIDYSVDSGESWKNIGAVILGTSIDWTVPNAPTANAMIRVRDTVDVVGTSSPFFIAPPAPAAVRTALIHYWNFDAVEDDTISARNPTIPDMHPDYSSLDASKAKIVYYLLSGTSLTSSLRFIDPTPGSDTNLRSVVPTILNQGLRLRNPLDSMELRCYIPTTGHTRIVVKYALESSSTASGDSTNIFDYSVDGGLTWKNGKSSGMKVNGLNVDTLDTTPAVYQGSSWGLVKIDLSADKTVENNPNVVFRIRFKGNTALAKGNNRIDNFTVEGDTASAGEQNELVHYWNFDNVANDTISPRHPSIPDMHPDYSVLDVSKAKIAYYLLPGTSLTSSLRFIDPTPGSDTNVRSVVPTILNQGLRLRNPLDSMELRCFIPTTGHKHIIIQYAVESSSTASGDSTEIFDYSIDGGATWKNGRSAGMKVNGSNVDTLDTTPALYQGSSWGLVTIDLSADKSVEDNPNLVFRIRFKGNTSLAKGNNRIDNFTVEGTTSSVAPPPPPSITIISPAKGDTLVMATHHTIRFSVSGPVSAKRIIDFSPNGGTAWNPAGTVTGANTFDWTVSNAPTEKGVIRITDTTGVTAKSGTFVIVAPGSVVAVTVGSTPGRVKPGDSVFISWTTTGYLGGTVNIDLSVDSQKTWIPVRSAFAYKSKSNFLWGVPSATHNGAVIRVAFASGATGISAPFDIMATAGIADKIMENNVRIWPNPLSRNASVEYLLAEDGDVVFAVYDITGREVQRIVRGFETAGIHSMIFDGSVLPEGTYYYTLTTGKQIIQGKMIVVK